MSEELIQRGLIASPEKMGVWDFYNIGSTTLKALKNAHIIPDHDYADFEGKKPDAIVTNRSEVIAVIEYKTPSALRTQKQIAAAIGQELGTARALRAKIYIITDGKRTFWIDPVTGDKILQEDGSEITLGFDKDSADCIRLMNKIISSFDSKSGRLGAGAPVDPLPLARKVWQDLWSVSGATPENCLYTFVEIFIFKYLSDLGVLAGMHSFDDLLRRYSSNTEEEVLEYYALAVRVQIKRLFPGSPRDGTTIINGTIFVSKDDKAVSGYATVFHRILKRFHEFGTLENIDHDFKSRLFETFLKESISKKNWGQYFTPLKVVRAIVGMADLRPGMAVCDPACGVGKFLLEAVLPDLHRYYPVVDGGLRPQITLTGLDKGFDKEEQKTIILAKANMLIYMSELIREHPDMTRRFSDLFNDTFLLQTNSILGTLARPAAGQYDLILTNPPFVVSGSSNLKDEIAKDEELKSFYAVNAMGIEGLFMEWIVRALKPGGKAFVIVPDGIMYRNNDKKLRDFILEQCSIDGAISLPLNTFFTTNKKTYILILTKKVPEIIDGVPTLKRQTTPVFTYLCSEIGETRDTDRFDIEQNDLETARNLYCMFKGSNKERFRTDDARCKIVPIDTFYDGSHWSVERWWSREERIALGIEQEVRPIHVNDLRILLSDAVSALSELDEPLNELEKKNTEDDLIFQPFSLRDLFQIERGKGRYTKSYVQSHKGAFPLYSGNTFGAFAQIDSYDYDHPCLTWAIDGLAGYIMAHDEPFSATNHRGVLIPQTDRIDLGYVRYVLEPIFRNAKKGREGANGQNEYTSLPPFMVEHLTIDLPVDDRGDPDPSAQRAIAERYETIEQIKQIITKMRDAIADPTIVIDTGGYPIGCFALRTLFDTIKGPSRYTKKYGNAHPGPYPVWSASAQKPLTYLAEFDYDGRYLSWSTNGFAGNISILEGRFSINGDRGILIPKDGRSDLDYGYMKFILEPIFREHAKGRKGDNGENEFTKLYPSMIADIMVPVPVDSNGDPDPMAQRAIAERYETIEQIRKEAVGQLETLLRQEIIV